VLASQTILDWFQRDPVGFANSLATMDELWIHIRMYDQESKEQSQKWRHSGSPVQTSLNGQKLTSKVLSSVFWNKDGVLHVDYLGRGQPSPQSITLHFSTNWSSSWSPNLDTNFRKEFSFFKTILFQLSIRNGRIFTLKFAAYSLHCHLVEWSTD
jgi:hypothetical protein